MKKIKRHTHIRGNDLADAAAKIAVRSFDTLPPAQTTRVDVGKIAPRPKYWVMYTLHIQDTYLDDYPGNPEQLLHHSSTVVDHP
jgi:hypothetical protein